MNKSHSTVVMEIKGRAQLREIDPVFSNGCIIVTGILKYGEPVISRPNAALSGERTNEDQAKVR